MKGQLNLIVRLRAYATSSRPKSRFGKGVSLDHVSLLVIPSRKNPQNPKESGTSFFSVRELYHYGEILYVQRDALRMKGPERRWGRLQGRNLKEIEVWQILCVSLAVAAFMNLSCDTRCPYQKTFADLEVDSDTISNLDGKDAVADHWALYWRNVGWRPVRFCANAVHSTKMFTRQNSERE